MKFIRKTISLAICMALVFFSVAPAEESVHEHAMSLIDQIIVTYASEGVRDEQALADLAAADPVLGDKWRRIMDLWETPVNILDELPDVLPEDDSLCLVALGFQLNPDGSMKDELIGRLETVLAAAEKYPCALVVCTGGGTAANEPSATEAGKMAEWLQAHGVDPARLIVEDRSMTTAQNAIFTVDLLINSYPQVRQIAVISSDYHIPAGVLAFGAEIILRDSDIGVAGNSAWRTGREPMTGMYQGYALMMLSANTESLSE